jgi:hypothetical protein
LTYDLETGNVLKEKTQLEDLVPLYKWDQIWAKHDDEADTPGNN